jgi:hypothetical protein
MSNEKESIEAKYLMRRLVTFQKKLIIQAQQKAIESICHT